MKGQVKYANYKTGGKPVFKGLRNKRKKYAAKVRKEEIERKKKMEELLKSLEVDSDYQ